MPRIRTAALILSALALAGCGRGGSGSATLREPDTASRLHVADTAAAAGQTDIALSMYGAAARAAPADVDVQSRYIGLLLRTSQVQLADEVLSQAMSHHSRSPVLRRWLGVIRLENGLPAEAQQIFDELLTRAPRDVALLNGRGMALDLQGQHQAAQQAYRLALAEVPGDVRSSNNLAVSLLLSDQPAAAAAVLAPFARQGDAPARVLNNLAIAQAASGDAASAQPRLSPPGAVDLRALATLLGAPASDDAGHDPGPAIRQASPAG